MGQRVQELLHVAAATLFVVAGVSALLEYRHLRERVVLTYGAMCLCAAGYAAHVAVSHSLPKEGEFWIPWTAVGLCATFGATFFYLLTMRTYLEVRGRLFGVALGVQAALTAIALVDALLYTVARRSFLFVAVPRAGLSEAQQAVGEGAYSLLPFAEIVAGLFALSFVLGVGHLLVHLVRTRSRDLLVYAGLVANATIVVNDTLVALSVFAGWYLVAFSKALETTRIHRDIRTRARERMERRLRQAEKMEAIGRMAGGIAHDFNNVLMAVGGSVDLAAESIEPSHPAREDLAVASEGVGAGRRLVRQLLDLARSEDTRAEHVDVNAFFDGNTKLLTTMVSREVSLKIAAAPEIGGVMIAPGRLTQVLMNLVINACEAMPEGGTVTIEARGVSGRPRLSESPSAPAIAISVIDEGSGIPPDVIERVFEPFFTTKAERGGSGLGLATIYQIVREAGGNIEVVSEVGQGTRFDVVLPRHVR